MLSHRASHDARAAEVLVKRMPVNPYTTISIIEVCNKA